MGTVVEGPVERILAAVRIVHESPFSQGAVRVLTRATIDDRRDKEATAAGKVRSVEEKWGRGRT